MKNNITSEKLASIMARILDDNKAQDIVVLNVSNVCSLSDYFIIATGTSTPHIRALTEAVRQKIKDIFIDEKINLDNRDSLPVVTDSNDEIIWLPGIKKSKFDKQKSENYDIIIKYL